MRKLWGLLRDKCWHDWHYHDTAWKNEGEIRKALNELGRHNRFVDDYQESIFIDRMYYKRVCIKCNRCEDTITPAVEKMKKTILEKDRLVKEQLKKRELGEKLWRDKCESKRTH